MVALETKNADVLAPYMNLDQTWCSTFESVARLCGVSPLPACPVTSTTGNWQRYCAQQVILFARGWDVMDQDGDGCGGPGFGTSYASYASMTQPNPANGTSATSNKVISTSVVAGVPVPAYGSCVLSSSGSVNYTGEERDRLNDASAVSDLTVTQTPSFYKMADIFHSAPVLVHPPTSEAMCKLGLDNQCVRTAFGFTSNVKYTTGYQTALDTYDGCKTGSGQVDAYRAWRTDHASRQNVVLVGSNDGFLHAFDAGGPDTSTTDPNNKTDVDCVWPNVLDGSGEELWAFVPPDLLPRLRDTSMNHQYMVDGNIMVRDVWVDGAAADGSTNNPVQGTGNSLDGKKQKNEFRTVAIFGERAGGTQFTALDITDAFSTTASVRPRPTFRWTFPPPRSDDAQYMGQSWSDFSPRPPPIGPVRLIPDVGDKATGQWVPDPTKPTQVEQFTEKWVVMLNGGYDPSMNRGRAVWTVDAWTGSVYWRYTDADFKANLFTAANTTSSMFPVPAAVGMMDIGDPVAGSSLDSDNFFDTATWGDLGGNLFVARFDRPGKRTGGRVTNWRAARTFEQGRTTGNTQNATNRSEFFYMTSNAWEPQQHQLRTLLGSGNREQILEQGQGCGPDNLLSCCQAGCGVTTTSTLDYGVCKSTGTFNCTATGDMTSSPVFSQGCGTSGASACTGGSSNTFVGTATYSLSCGSSSSSTATGTSTCDANGLCTVTPVGTGHDLTPPGAASCTNKSKFYGVWAYGGWGVPQKTFSTDPTADYTTAKTFDDNRFTDVASFVPSSGTACSYTPDHTCSLVETTQAKVTAAGNLSCLDGSTKCQATVSDPGWFYQYNVTCPTAVSCTSGCTNEKTASGSAIVNSCSSWNSFLPKGSAASGSDPCQSANTAQQLAIGYSADFVSGVPNLACNQGLDKANDVAYRGAQRSTIAPPAAPMARNSVTRGGTVYYSTLQLDPGAPATSTGSGSRDVGSQLYWLELSREAHSCRHVGTPASGTTNCE